MLEKCFRFSSWLLWHRLSSSNTHLTSSCCYLAPLRENIMKMWVLTKRKTCQVITLQHPCDLVNAATSLIISLYKLKSLAPHIKLAVVLSYQNSNFKCEVSCIHIVKLPLKVLPVGLSKSAFISVWQYHEIISEPACKAAKVAVHRVSSSPIDVCLLWEAATPNLGRTKKKRKDDLNQSPHVKDFISRQ